jgi:putative ABC transport system substrate-binding protein
MPETYERSAADWRGIRAAMKNAGLEDGVNLILERRYSFDDPRKHYPNAEELVAAGVDLIYAVANDRLDAAFKATKTIPIVTMANAIVELGYAKSLARPGGNVTGMEFQGQETIGKQLELLHLMMPGIRRIGLVRSLREERVTDALTANMQAAAATRRVTVVPVRTDLPTFDDIEPMLAAAKREGVQALWFAMHRGFLHGLGFQRVQAWAAENSIVTTSGWYHRGEVMLTHGPHPEEIGSITWRLAARILLRGARPADLPIEQPTRFDVVLNQKYTRAIGLTIPLALRLQATEVIE